MNENQKFSTGIVWSYLQSWAARGITTLSFLIVGFFMGPEEFGIFALISGLLLLAEMVCQQALSQTIVQLQTNDTNALSIVFFLALVLGLIFSTSFLIVGLVWAFPNSSTNISSLFIWASVCPVVIGLTTVPIGLIRKELDFKTLARRTITASGISSIVGVLLVIYGYGAKGLIIQTILYYCISTYILWMNCKWRPSFIKNANSSPMILRLTIANASGKVLDYIETRGIEILIGSVAGLEALGVYAFASKVAQTAFQTLVSPVIEVVFSGVARGKEYFVPSLLGGQLIVSTIPLTGLVFLAYSGPSLLTLAYGDTWSHAALPLSILALAYAVRSFLYCYGMSLSAIGRYKTTLIISTIRVATCITSAVLILTIYNRVDLVALAYLFSAIMVLPITIVAVSQIAELSIRKLTNTLYTSLISFFIGSMPIITIMTFELISKSNLILQLTTAFLAGLLFLSLNFRLNQPQILLSLQKTNGGQIANLIKKLTIFYRKF